MPSSTYVATARFCRILRQPPLMLSLQVYDLSETCFRARTLSRLAFIFISHDMLTSHPHFSLRTVTAPGKLPMP